MADPEAVATLVRAGIGVTAWRVRLAGRPASEAVGELARLGLAARRTGGLLRVSAPYPLGRLLDAAGLGSSVEAVGEAEDLEELRVAEVQEVVVTDDPLA